MKPIHFAGVLTLALIWGASFMFVAVMLREMSPLAVAWSGSAAGAR